MVSHLWKNGQKLGHIVKCEICDGMKLFHTPEKTVKS